MLIYERKEFTEEKKSSRLYPRGTVWIFFLFYSLTLVRVIVLILLFSWFVRGATKVYKPCSHTGEHEDIQFPTLYWPYEVFIWSREGRPLCLLESWEYCMNNILIKEIPIYINKYGITYTITKDAYLSIIERTQIKK